MGKDGAGWESGVDRAPINVSSIDVIVSVKKRGLIDLLQTV